MTPNQGVLQGVETHSCKLVYKAIKHSWLTINSSELLVNLVNRLAGYAPHGASEKTFGTAGRGRPRWLEDGELTMKHERVMHFKLAEGWKHMGMDQYLLIPFLVGWTSIYQLFWCSPGVPGFWHTATSKFRMYDSRGFDHKSRSLIRNVWPGVDASSFFCHPW